MSKLNRRNIFSLICLLRWALRTPVPAQVPGWLGLRRRKAAGGGARFCCPGRIPNSIPRSTTCICSFFRFLSLPLVNYPRLGKMENPAHLESFCQSLSREIIDHLAKVVRDSSSTESPSSPTLRFEVFLENVGNNESNSHGNKDGVLPVDPRPFVSVGHLSHDAAIRVLRHLDRDDSNCRGPAQALRKHPHGLRHLHHQLQNRNTSRRRQLSAPPIHLPLARTRSSKITLDERGSAGSGLRVPT